MPFSRPKSRRKEANAVQRRIRPVELGLCVLICIACAALHFPVVYYRFGVAIEIGLSLVSFATPVSGMLYLSASQVIPDPPNFPLSSSRLALAGFLLWQLRLPRQGLVQSSWPILVGVMPFFFWNSLMGLIHESGVRPVLNLIYAILTAGAAATLVKQSGKQTLLCLGALLAGQALAACVFWIIKLHLGVPVQAFDVLLYGDSTLESARIGTARGNANMLGTPMALLAIGIVAFWSFRHSSRACSWRFASACGCLLALALPALLGSSSRGALGAVACGLLFLTFVSQGGKSRPRYSSLGIVIAVVTAVLCVGWKSLDLGSYLQEMQTRQERQAGESVYGLIAGRETEWLPSISAIFSSPLFGGAEAEVLNQEYQANPELWASHSTYLDAGLTGGIPGMVLFLLFTATPLSKLWSRRHDATVAMLLTLYAVSLVCIGTTSAMASKHFWILWGVASCHFAHFYTGIWPKRRVKLMGSSNAPGSPLSAGIEQTANPIRRRF